jgi:hypothetical protein
MKAAICYAESNQTISFTFDTNTTVKELVSFIRVAFHIDETAFDINLREASIVLSALTQHTQSASSLVSLGMMDSDHVDVINVYSGGMLLSSIKSHSLIGGGPSFEFSDMSAKKTYNWNKGAPEWRVAAPGLSYEGICKTKSCKAFEVLFLLVV